MIEYVFRSAVAASVVDSLCLDLTGNNLVFQSCCSGISLASRGYFLSCFRETELPLCWLCG